MQDKIIISTINIKNDIIFQRTSINSSTTPFKIKIR